MRPGPVALNEKSVPRRRLLAPAGTQRRTCTDVICRVHSHGNWHRQASLWQKATTHLRTETRISPPTDARLVKVVGSAGTLHPSRDYNKAWGVRVGWGLTSRPRRNQAANSSGAFFLPRSPPFRRELHHVLRHSILRQRPELRLHTFARRWHEIAWRAAGDPRISARKVAQAVGAFVEEINNRSAAPGPSSASPA